MPRLEAPQPAAAGSATAIVTVKRHNWLRMVAGVVAVWVLAFTTATFLQIESQSRRDEAQKADCIVVFGAAEYSGHPSPVLRARLDHAYNLFRRGLAPMVITTGGYGGDPRFSEGGVGRGYLMGRGIPEKNIIAETQAENTNESVARVAAIMNANRMHTCLAVSDGYHIFRVKKMLERQGIVVYGGPRPQSRPYSKLHEMAVILREVVSYGLWRIGNL